MQKINRVGNAVNAVQALAVTPMRRIFRFGDDSIFFFIDSPVSMLDRK